MGDTDDEKLGWRIVYVICAMGFVRFLSAMIGSDALGIVSVQTAFFAILMLVIIRMFGGIEIDISPTKLKDNDEAEDNDEIDILSENEENYYEPLYRHVFGLEQKFD